AAAGRTLAGRPGAPPGSRGVRPWRRGPCWKSAGGPRPACEAARAGDFDRFVWTSCPHFPREGRGRYLEEGKLTVRFGGVTCKRRFAADKCRRTREQLE